MYYNLYLSHHGILGQRWGKKNGPPYPLSSGQKSSKEKKMENAGKYFDQNIKGGKDRPNKSAAQVVTTETSNIIDDIRMATRDIQRLNGIDQPIELTDAELREVINRLNMEKQYKELIAKDSTIGLDIIKDIVSVVGSLVAISSTIYTITNKK